MIKFVYRRSGGKMGIFVARDKRIPYGRYRGERGFERVQSKVGMGEKILEIVWNMLKRSAFIVNFKHQNSMWRWIFISDFLYNESILFYLKIIYSDSDFHRVSFLYSSSILE